MKHYIEREKLVDNINALRAFTDLGIDGSFLHARVLELIDSLPVANVREVKHGTWEDSVFCTGGVIVARSASRSGKDHSTIDHIVGRKWMRPRKYKSIQPPSIRRLY